MDEIFSIQDKVSFLSWEIDCPGSQNNCEFLGPLQSLLVHVCVFSILICKSISYSQPGVSITVILYYLYIST